MPRVYLMTYFLLFLKIKYRFYKKRLSSTRTLLFSLIKHDFIDGEKLKVHVEYLITKLASLSSCA